MGVGIFLLALGGVALALVRHCRRGVILLAFPLPFLALLAAFGLAALTEWIEPGADGQARWVGDT